MELETTLMANSSAEPYHASELSGNAFREYLTAMSGWQIAATILMVLITYDQSQKISPRDTMIRIADTPSHVHQEQRINCRANVQDSIHGTIHSSTISRF
jgi:hypothetical protein